MYQIISKVEAKIGEGEWQCEFVCDTESDVAKLPTSTKAGTGGKTVYDNHKCEAGSSAYIVDDNAAYKLYILNNQNEWVPQGSGSDYSGGGGSYVPVTAENITEALGYTPADDAEVTQLKSDLFKETSERKAEIAVERERINQFTRLEGGSTTGDAELNDARIDFDGITHNNVGDHIRSASTKLSERIVDEAEKTHCGSYISEDMTETIGIENAYYDNTGYRYDYDAACCTLKFEVKKNEVYYLSGHTVLDIPLAMIGDLRETGPSLTNVTLIGNANGDYNDLEVVIPKDGYMVVQSIYTNTLSVKKRENVKVKDYVDEKTIHPLNGKKLIFDGDSICENRATWTIANNGGGYAKLLCDKTGATFVNRGVSGGLLRTLNGFTTDSNHSVYDTVSTLPTDGDLYCFEGGINDFWQNVEIGEVTATPTSEIDVTTVCGALEGIFRYALDNFVGKPICFIIVHKCQNVAISTNTTGKTFTEYHDKMVEVCNKYSIPYYDAFLESGLNGWNETQSNLYLTANPNGVGDGTHPNAEGYMRYYVPQLIDLFERIMP